VLAATLERRLIGDVDAQLAQRIEGLKVLTSIEGESVSRLAEELHEFEREIPNGSLFEVRDSAGDLLLQGADGPRLPAAVWDGLNASTLEWRGERIRTLARTYRERGSDYTAAVAIPLQGVSAVMKEVRNLMITAIPGVVLIAIFGGYWISRRALAPVDEITQIARSISAQNLSSRLPVINTGDELQRMSEAWNDVLARLESALKRIRDFTADASHELRTPVALIRTTAELALRKDRDEETYRRALRDIQEHAERMSELTESLLTLARADAIGGELNLVETNLIPIVEESVRQIAPLAEEKGVVLESLLPSQPAFTKVNGMAIRRLLVILLDNAVKYTHANGRIIVSLVEVNGQFRLSVADTGIGIEASKLPHVFERFYRADPARSLQGAGLGLPIAQLIAEAHGSFIQAESRLGMGSTFSLHLPVGV
jgi:heavy metal sensor kinase